MVSTGVTSVSEAYLKYFLSIIPIDPGASVVVQ